MAPTASPSPAGSDGAGSRALSNNKNKESPPAFSSPSSSASVNDHLAQALRDLARGEQTASALEANLSSLESRLDDILASLGVSAEDLDGAAEQEEQPEDGDGKAAADASKKGSA